MHRECRERFPATDFKGNRQLVIPACITARALRKCISRSLTRGGGENVPGIPGACATRNFTYLTVCQKWITMSASYLVLKGGYCRLNSKYIRYIQVCLLTTRMKCDLQQPNNAPENYNHRLWWCGAKNEWVSTTGCGNYVTQTILMLALYAQ